MKHLRWSKVKRHNRYVLRDERGAELAEMAFKTWFSGDATVRVGDASYAITLPSWWKSRYVVSDGTGKEIGGFTHGWNGKTTLDLRGKTYVWTWTNWWATQWKWVDAQGGDVLHVRAEGWWWQDAAVDVVGDAGEHEALLAAIGWHTLLMSMQNSSGM